VRGSTGRNNAKTEEKKRFNLLVERENNKNSIETIRTKELN